MANAPQCVVDRIGCDPKKLVASLKGISIWDATSEPPKPVNQAGPRKQSVGTRREPDRVQYYATKEEAPPVGTIGADGRVLKANSLRMTVEGPRWTTYWISRERWDAFLAGKESRTCKHRHPEVHRLKEQIMGMHVGDILISAEPWLRTRSTAQGLEIKFGTKYTISGQAKPGNTTVTRIR